MSNGGNRSQYKLFRGSVCHWNFLGTNKFQSGVAQVNLIPPWGRSLKEGHFKIP